MIGRWCRVEPVDVERHAADLHEANCDDREGRNFTYFGYGPFADLASYREWLTKAAATDDPFFHAVVDARTNQAIGVAALMRIEPQHGSIEVGHVLFSPRLQRTTAATEAIVLMMRRVFDELGYRRFEWKCDNLNAPSHAAARRFGFKYEGLFRQHMVTKGRNRDTAWYSMLDTEWRALEPEFARWLDPDNFDTNGRQRTRLRVSQSSGG
jgi:RimJ/RimL family protein N-acetyltransferase